MNPYESLANAIIVLAVKDYRRALRTLKYYPNDIHANMVRDECERFFQSGWFSILTNLDGQVLMDKVRTQALQGGTR